ncbi:hypothetical protein [Propionibacterium acidifaciens]|uniref:hypothetical protein n=1 Tax=Propionibacterium acidifaciens TaxID=556499 RepID=UPI0028DBAA64|nr:hypothetical protein [Propionibacterium acidifaciens]
MVNGLQKETTRAVNPHGPGRAADPGVPALRAALVLSTATAALAALAGPWWGPPPRA